MELSEKTFPSNLGIPHMTTLAAKSLGGGGAYPSNLILYQAKQASGPNTSAGSKNPADSQNFDYWSVLSITGAVPVGTIIWYSSSTAPVGYLICNGQAVSRTLYPDLFTAIGTTYGEGDGSTTFNLPNLLNKFIEGANSGIGDSVDAGLPNIIGAFQGRGSAYTTYSGAVLLAEGSFAHERHGGSDANAFAGGDSVVANDKITLNASRSSSIYGNSSTVQPPAVKLLPCIKAYSGVDNLGSLDVAQLENEVENNCVHRTGDETISGVKIFQDEFDDFPDEVDVKTISAIHIRHTPDVIKGQPLPDEYPRYAGILMYDGSGSIHNHVGRLCSIMDMISPTGLDAFRIDKYKNVDHSSGGITPPSEGVTFFLGWDSNGIPMSTAVSTPLPSLRNGDTDILTRDWIPKDVRILHTDDNSVESINGIKHFTGMLGSKGTSPNFCMCTTAIASLGQWASANHYGIIPFGLPDSNGNANIDLNTRLSAFFTMIGTTANKLTEIGLQVWANTNASSRNSVSVVLSHHPDTGFTFYPSSGGNVYLGKSNSRWKEVWCTQSAINTSDSRLKSTIHNIPDEVLDAWGDIDWQQFKMVEAVKEKGDEKARIHTGLIAQDMQEIFRDKNLDISRYSLFCYDEWEAQEEFRDESGQLMREAVPAGNIYSIRYTEALCMEAAYNRREVKRLKEEINLLKQRLDSLENS